MKLSRRLLLLALCLLVPLQSLAIDGPVYEVFVASFADGDGDQRGDLKGLTQKLDYIADLGVAGIWLMPISPSPSYHKYDVTDYKAIDPAYGTMADFAALSAASDERGLSLILDLVLAHSSSQHPWFLEASQALAKGDSTPYTDYYMFNQQGGHPVPGASGWYYEGHFGPHMPHLNLDSAALRDEIREIMAFWLAAGADGFRLDATAHYYENNTAKNTAFLEWLVQTARDINPKVYFVAEAWTDAGTILSLSESGIDSLFNFPMAGATGTLVEDLRNEKGEALSNRVEGWQASLLGRNPGAVDAPFLSNHDMARSAGYLMFKPQRMKLAAAVYLTMPGIPYVYYGEELGLSGSGRDENKRLPMLWSAQDTASNTLPPADADQNQRLKAGVDVQQEDPESLLRFYQHVLSLRRQHPEFTRGVASAIATCQPALAAWRLEMDGKSITVVHNLSDQRAVYAVNGLALAGSWDTGSGLPTVQGSKLILPGYSGAILR